MACWSGGTCSPSYPRRRVSSNRRRLSLNTSAAAYWIVRSSRTMTGEIVGFAPVSLPFFAGQGGKPLPLHIGPFRNRRGLALGAGNADLISVGEAVGRGDDDTVVRRDARCQLDIAAGAPILMAGT